MTTSGQAGAVDALLKEMVEKKASDLHLAVGSSPAFRVNGVLVADGAEPLTSASVQEMLYEILDRAQQEKLEQSRELDFSYSLPGVSRFRGNALWQRGTLGAVFRAIPERPLTLDELKLPAMLKEFCTKPRGLILVTGPTGSGKSTTLAAMIEQVNVHHAVHVVTIEDPIEFLYKNKKAIIRQRELGSDTRSFAEALKHALRQDPDVILVGEMRDLETIALAVTAAETGHLVFGTLHTTGAAATVDRVVDVVPAERQQQIRVQVAEVLEGVLSQTLIRRKDGKGRVCAMEIMVGTTAIRNLIREGKTHQILSVIQSGAKVGMVALDMALKALVAEGQVAFEDALSKSTNPEDFKRLCGQTGASAI
ncbi:MAG: type IV pilus twitching motility protein PilT [Candidatus Omnitrophica bacterium]|nr:type IV pilus twitching motility protein PilT [Candidatus Omnitrophota bacterium]